jgi:hypothetical protein
MSRKLTPFLLLALTLALGCAGPSKLAERSEDKLSQGQMWRAWTLATQALDKAPGNQRARAAAEAAASAIAADWRRRIGALASTDSLAAAEQVMEFVAFRTGAANYVTVPIDDAWARNEQALRMGAARAHYRDGADDLKTKRPKAAYRHLVEAERFWPGYRDAAALAGRALEQGLTRVAIVPLRSASRTHAVGREVAASWRGDIVEHLSPASAYFTRLLPSEDVERAMSVSDLGGLTRDQAIRLGRKAGAQRIVWGSIGEVDSKSGVQFFSDKVARRITERETDGGTTTRWIEVPIEVIARTRTVDVDLEYEIIGTRDGATLARRHDTRTMKARVVWTAYTPEGSPDTYSLVSEETRVGDPERAKQIETRWKAVVGEGTTLAQVLDAKRASVRQPSDTRQVLARLMAGAAFVMLEDLPPTQELAFGALAGGWQPVHQDLLRLDAVDDVDLGMTAGSPDTP